MRIVNKIVAPVLLLTVTIGLCCLAVCKRPSTARVHALPVFERAVQPAAASAAASTVTSTDPKTLAIIHVRARPLYQQAQQACTAKRYALAADLLLKLSQTPGLSQDELKFCQSQLAVCRKDARLPALRARDNGSDSVSNQGPRTSNQHQVLPNAQHRTPDTFSDCGPRALAIVCTQLGVHSDLAALRKSAGTTKDGTTMEGLAKAAKALGLNADGIQTGRDALPHLQLPAIAWYRGNHFVAVLEIKGGPGDAGTARIHDPNEDHETTISQEELLRRSGGYLLLVHR